MTIIPIRFESGLQKNLTVNELLSEEVETEERFTIKNSSNKEIYFYGIYVNEKSACLANFQNLNTFLLENRENGFQQHLPKTLYKDVKQVANNFFYINSYTNLRNCKDLIIELIRSIDVNSKCNNEIREKYTLMYYMA